MLHDGDIQMIRSSAKGALSFTSVLVTITHLPLLIHVMLFLTILEVSLCPVLSGKEVRQKLTIAAGGNWPRGAHQTS